jgi:hypothetical protein
VRRDWLSLINQGFYRPGTGVSDSHRITVEHAGWSRTYVNGAGSDPAALNVTAFDNQVKAGNMMFTSGPYVEFTAKATTGGATAGFGQLLESTDGKVQLKIKVRSAAWIPVEEVRIIANGFVVASFDSTTIPRVRPPSTKITGTATMRFNATVKMTVAQDTYFIVEAGAKLPADPNTAPTPPANMSVIEPDVVPEAVTNPIFVDRNGNSTFDPPGLPVLMASNTTETRPMFARVQIDATDPNGGRGVWDEIWSGLMRLAQHFSTTTVTAQEVPGQMTGVTKEQKKESVKKGEYFPLREFALPPDAAEKALQAEKAAEESTSPPAEPAAKPENN